MQAASKVEYHSDFCVLRISRDLKTQKAVLFLPGFPAVLSKRNEDLAARIAESLPADVFVLQYKGMGHNKDGPFSFELTLRESSACLDWLKARYEKISLVGHSWGGALSLAGFRQLGDQLDKMVLMSPLLKLQEGDRLAAMIHEICTQFGYLFPSISEAEMLRDIQVFSRSFHVETFLHGHTFSKGQVSFVQALQDEQTPPDIARRLISLFGPHVSYTELDQDHSFLKDREEIFTIVNRALSGRAP